MKKFSNEQKISLSLAVWLAEDLYIHNTDPMYISATGLLKSPKQIILSTRIPAPAPGTLVDDLILEDLSSRVPMAMGNALHTGIESAWKNSYKRCMEDLGYPHKVIERVLINPEPNELKDNSIPVYLEKRVEKKLGPFIISGQYDLVIDGKLNDYKSTGVYGYMKGNNDDKYRIQGSIYRWLNPEIITDAWMEIQFIFTDWSKLRANIESKKGYPQSRVLTHPIELMSIDEIVTWIKTRLTIIHKYKDLPESEMPNCTQEELWQKPPTYKYYKNPEKTKRATANFTDYYLAEERLVADGSVGIIKTTKGQVKACAYCAAFPVCLQKNIYLENGTLTV